MSDIHRGVNTVQTLAGVVAGFISTYCSYSPGSSEIDDKYTAEAYMWSVGYGFFENYMRQSIYYHIIEYKFYGKTLYSVGWM